MSRPYVLKKMRSSLNKNAKGYPNAGHHARLSQNNTSSEDIGSNQAQGNRTPWTSSILLHPLHDILPSLTGCLLHTLPAIPMRVAGKVPNFLVPSVLQNIFDRNLLVFPTSSFFETFRLMFWENASVVCASGSSEPVYLANLFADLSALFEPRCAVDCDGDV